MSSNYHPYKRGKYLRADRGRGLPRTGRRKHPGGRAQTGGRARGGSDRTVIPVDLEVQARLEIEDGSNTPNFLGFEVVGDAVAFNFLKTMGYQETQVKEAHIIGHAKSDSSLKTLVSYFERAVKGKKIIISTANFELQQYGKTRDESDFTNIQMLLTKLLHLLKGKDVFFLTPIVRADTAMGVRKIIKFVKAQMEEEKNFFIVTLEDNLVDERGSPQYVKIRKEMVSMLSKKIGVIKKKKEYIDESPSMIRLLKDVDLMLEIVALGNEEEEEFQHFEACGHLNERFTVMRQTYSKVSQ